MSEFIGSRISLISKSDIRYVGTLKAIDSDSATVSLEHVQCMGSEGRKEDPSQEVAANDLIYDGIVFRGSDVKDLSILAAPSQPQQLNDPAIVQQQQLPPTPQQQTSSLPQQRQQQQHQQPQHNHQQPPHPQHHDQFRGPQYPPQYQQHQPPYGYQPGPPPNQFQQPPRFGGPGGAHGFPGTPGAVPAYGMPPPGYGMDARFGPPGQNFPPGAYPPPMPIGPPGQHGHQQRAPQQMPSHQAPIGSKEPTPQPPAAQAPPPPQKPPVEMSTTPAASAGIPPPPPIDSKPSVTAATVPPPAGATQRPKPAQNKANSRVAVPLATPGAAKPVAKTPIQSQVQPNAQPAAAQSTQATSTEAATAAVAAAMAKLANLNQTSDGVDNLASTVNQMRLQDGQTRGRGGRGRGGPRGGRRDGPQKTVEVPKEDFDFESANAKFNKQDLLKEAIASGSPVSSPQNGTAPDPLASSSNGHANGVEDVVIPAKPTTEKGYDKKSSFFDNISSDLKDRTEQMQAYDPVDGRAMRREERSKNVETFGQGSVDGGFRGRGRGRGGRGGFNRGGGRGFYGGGAPRGGNGGAFDNRSGFRGGERGRGAMPPV